MHWAPASRLFTNSPGLCARHTGRVPASRFEFFDQPFAAFAHRGGRVDEADCLRENTLYAFEQAVRLGYRYLETAVPATADGHLIAFHDDRLDRVTDRSGRVADLTLRQIRQARIGGIDQIPTLEELLEAFPQARLNIDIKAPSALAPLVRTIRRHQAQRRVCVGSFSNTSLRRFRSLMGRDVATAVSPAGVLAATLVPSWLTRRFSTGVAFQIPTTYRVHGLQLPVLSSRLLETAQRHGQRVQVWTINDADMMNALIDAGVDGLMTDRIDVLKQVLLTRGLWT